MLHPRLITSAVLLLLLIAVTPSTWAQENAERQIPPSLVECYNTSYYMNRDNRLPSTINTLIDLIRKVENSPDFNMDIRTLAVSLLYRFRQDGIKQASIATATPGVLPYSPTEFQFDKFRFMLTKLIQGNANNFPNSSLTQEERCSMHFMLSSSFNLRVRGDEGTVCNQLSQYRSYRLPRSVDSNSYKSKFRGDVEKLKGQSVQYQVSVSSDQVSQCPVENGVIWTQWGSVAAGNLIAGIAAGLQPQTIQLNTLLRLARLPRQTRARQSTVGIDNRWACTLAGDLAEVTLLQVPRATNNQASVGSSGAWNDTVMAKWYFLSQMDNLELTDAEIRGDLDGLILAMNIANWKSQSSSLKLSQLLSMYYSLGGVLNSGIMACNRQSQLSTVAPLNDMISQTAAFSQALDTEITLAVTLDKDAIQRFAQNAANQLNSYIPAYLNDISCQASNPQTGTVQLNITTMTDIYVFLDVSWQYNTIVDVLAYVLERINVGPYASTVTLLGAGDCQIIANTTHYMSDVYQQWNVTTQSNFSPGFNLPLVLKTVQTISQNYMNEQQQNNTVGGRSMLVLMVPNTGTVNDGDSNYIQTQLQYIYEQVPDLRFIYYTGGSSVRFNSYVRDPSQDLFSITLGQNNVGAQGKPVVQRINQLQRRIINPRCGSSWVANSWGLNQMYQYIRPNYIAFYRIVPNYFYGAGSNRYVSVNGVTGTTLTVCTSRYTELPMSNATTSSGQTEVTCTQLTNSGSSMQYDLSNACNGYYTIHDCPPLYISVQATSTSSGSISSCIDVACQYPDQVRYTVAVNNMGCYSGVGKLLASLGLILLATVLRQLIV